MKVIVFFDFDGTITFKDSTRDFIKFAVGRPSYYSGLLSISPVLAAYALSLIPNFVAKERLIMHFFKGWDAVRFKELADRYAAEQIHKITRPKALEKISWHQENGHKVVIVSASMECWLKMWCDKKKIDLIATRLEFKDSKLTGKFASKNCYGIEKVTRIRKSYDLSQYDHIYCYGDSRGDKELLALADESFYRSFQD